MLRCPGLASTARCNTAGPQLASLGFYLCAGKQACKPFVFQLFSCELLQRSLVNRVASYCLLLLFEGCTGLFLLLCAALLCFSVDMLIAMTRLQLLARSLCEPSSFSLLPFQVLGRIFGASCCCDGPELALAVLQSAE